GKELKNVKGITWKDSHGKIYVNDDETVIENLDKMPFQASNLLSKKYFDIIAKKNPIAFMITSRGCPFGCKFCSAKFYSKKYRQRNPENVVSEIKYLVEMGFKNIRFGDDTFTVNKKRVIEICDIMKKEKIDIDWRCLSRVDTVDKEMIVKMKNSGCYQIHFGVESGSQKMLDIMEKGVKIEQIKQSFKMCDENGVETISSFVFGYPGETKESMEMSVEFANELKPDFVSFNVFTPLPGSDTFKNSQVKKWEEYDFTSTSFCDIKSSDIFNTVKKAYRDYYLNSSYFIRRVRKTKEPTRILKQNIKFWTKRSGVLWDFIKV
ncbi:MAG: radical SAM protein, partial [Candidatus Aenigmarchaeota archaeon]|nr:radical SAM protein [Candidatus Aenigmarchaeota archaeon]